MPTISLLEVSTYSEARVLQQALDDLALAYLSLRRLPELVVIVLHPKGRPRVVNSHEIRSRLEWCRLSAHWRVVELWTLSAAELLAAGDVGLVPWATLAEFEGQPERLLEQCRGRIEELASRDERANLLAVSQVLARLRYPQPNLLALLGGRRVMIESPLIQELLAERSQDIILEALRGRFGEVPSDVIARLRQVEREKQLKELSRHAAVCPDLEAFRRRLPPERPNGKRRRST